MTQTTFVSYALICGRKPANFKDLNGTTHGALHCDGEGKYAAGNKRWPTTCLCCGHQQHYTTYLLKQGRCTHCKATAAPEKVP
jgi:hypothetical protein